MKKVLWGTVALMLVASGAVAARVLDSSTAEPAQLAASSAPDEVSPAPPPGGPAVGIGVHAQWELTVVDETGHVVRQREFHNDLKSGGEFLLAHLLLGTVAIGNWTIQLQTDDGDTNEVCRPAGRCDVPATATQNGDGNHVDLAATLEPKSVAYEVVHVDTEVRRCFPNSGLGTVIDASPKACAATNSLPGYTKAQSSFSGTETSVQVQQGQIVQVRVKLTFGTLPSATS